MASQITSLTIVYSTLYSDADQRKHQSSVSLAFVRGIHRGPVNSPYKWPVTRKRFPFDDVIMYNQFVTDSHPFSVRDKWGKFSECKILGPFHWQFLLVFQIRWGVHLTASQLQSIRSQQKFVLATILQLSRYFQNAAVITLLESRWEQNEISISDLKCDVKAVSEMGPCSILCSTEYVHLCVLYCFVLVYHTISYCTVSGIVGYVVCYKTMHIWLLVNGGSANNLSAPDSKPKPVSKLRQVSQLS